MSPTRRLRSGLLLVLLAVVGAPVAVGAMATPASASVPTFESQLLALTNHDRAKHGLAPLTSSSTLVSIARSWSDHMAATGSLGHNPSLASKVSGWSALGENTAKAWSASQAETLFMGSAGHRANILKASYNRVGIGVTKAKDGSYWFTVDFEQTSGYHAPAPTHSTHPATHHSTTTSTRSSRAARSSRSSVRSAVPAVAKPAHVVLVAPATGRLDSRLTAIDARLSTQPLALPLPHLSGPRAAGPDPSAVALVVSGGLLVTALAAIATTRPPRVRVRGLSTWK